MKYQLSKDYIVRNIVDECLIVRVENADDESNKFYALNPTGKEIIDCITAGKSFDEIIEAFCDTFDVDIDTAKADVKEFIDEFIQIKVVEEIK